MEKFKKIWNKIPHTGQMTLLSIVVNTILMASGANKDTCEVVQKLLSSAQEQVQVVGGVE